MKRTNEEAMKYAKASLRLSGMDVSKEQEDLVRKSLEGDISEEDFINQLKKLADKKIK